jgi:hypothetical protein
MASVFSRVLRSDGFSYGFHAQRRAPSLVAFGERFKALELV